LAGAAGAGADVWTEAAAGFGAGVSDFEIAAGLTADAGLSMPTEELWVEGIRILTS
jgi:hypothetical protein